MDEEICSFYEDNMSNLCDGYDIPNVDCNYHTEDQFLETVSSNANSRLTLLHMNMRSVCKNFDKMLRFIDNITSGLVTLGVTETWFTSEADRNLFSISGFNLVNNNRPSRRGGGVALYIPSQLEYQIRHDLNTMSDQIETLFVEIDNPGQKNHIIGAGRDKPACPTSRGTN